MIILAIFIVAMPSGPIVEKKKSQEEEQKPNVHRDQSSVIKCFHSFSDKMFKQQFCLTWQEFFLLESLVLENMTRKEYN